MKAKRIDEELYNRKNYPILYLAKNKKDHKCEKVLRTRSGLVYFLITISIFLCIGILLNTFLKVQSETYERKIMKLNESISLEKKRLDRLILKISDLKSPALIMGKAEEDLDMEISDDLIIMKIDGSVLKENKSINKDLNEENASVSNKNSIILSVIYNMNDIVMVVSEGILTFFIP